LLFALRIAFSWRIKLRNCGIYASFLGIFALNSKNDFTVIIECDYRNNRK